MWLLIVFYPAWVAKKDSVKGKALGGSGLRRNGMPINHAVSIGETDRMVSVTYNPDRIDAYRSEGFRSYHVTIYF